MTFLSGKALNQHFRTWFDTSISRQNRYFRPLGIDLTIQLISRDFLMISHYIHRDFFSKK